MYWLPRDQFILESPLDKATCLAKITEQTKISLLNLQLKKEQKKAYKYRIQNEQFELQKNYTLSELFLKGKESVVKAKGTFQNCSNQSSRIQVSFHPNRTMIIRTLMIACSFPVFTAREMQNITASPSTAVPLLLLLFVVLICFHFQDLSAFKNQSKDLKIFLLELLQASECSF